MAFADFRLAHVAAGGIDQYLKILANQRVLFGGEARLQLLDGGSQIGANPLRHVGRDHGDPLIHPCDSRVAGAFGGVAGVDVDQQLRVLIASGDPGGWCLRECDRRKKKEENDGHYTSSIKATRGHQYIMPCPALCRMTGDLTVGSRPAIFRHVEPRIAKRSAARNS